VRSYLRSLKAALNWAHKQEWLDQPCRYEMLAADDGESTFKGRPLNAVEFEAMLGACAKVCPSDPESWRFLLRGLRESGLRLGEGMVVSWDDESQIIPLRTRGGGYLLRIPSRLQKRRKSEEIPTTPQFGALLDEVPNDQRTGWVFNPGHLGNRKARYTSHSVGQIITRIGKATGVILNGEGKAPSAHDLRRTFGQQLADAGVPPRDLQSIMRHSSFKTTEKYYLRHQAVEQAERLAQYLGDDRQESSSRCLVANP
jgi:integrase